jgi:flagellar biosynthesis anti-sigma factor FlgM
MERVENTQKASKAAGLKFLNWRPIYGVASLLQGICSHNQSRNSFMRIDFNNFESQPAGETSRSGSTSQAQSSGSATGASAAAANAAGGPAEDRAQFSAGHAVVQALVTRAVQSDAGSEQARAEKVQSLRQAVESGRYSANPSQVAGALLVESIAGSAA